MKKGLLSILAGALLVVGCQNYDDQFSALETQINALASTVAGLSQVQSDLSSLAGTVASLSSTVNGLGSTIDTAVADGLSDIQADVDAITAAVADVASSEEVDALSTAVADANSDLDELLANSAVFNNNVTINTVATLNAFHAMGSGLNIVNGNVTFTVSAGMDATKIQETVDNILTITGDLTYTGASTEAMPTFKNLSGVASMTIEGAGDYRFDNLVSAGNIILDNDNTAKNTIIHLGSLTTYSSLQDDGGVANTLNFSNATEFHLTSLKVLAGSKLNVTIDEGGTLAMGALTGLNSLDKTDVVDLDITGPSSVAFTTIKDGNIKLIDVKTASISDFYGAIEIGKGVETLTTTKAVALDLSAASDLETATIDIATDYDPLLSATAAATAAKAAAYIAVTFASQDLTTATVSGKVGTLTVDGQNNLTTLTVTGHATALVIQNNNDLSTLTVTGATIGDVTADNNDNMESLTLDHTSYVTTTDKGTKISVDGNEDLTSLSISASNVDDLSIQTNADLASINLTGMAAIGGTTANVAIDNNDLKTALVRDAYDATGDTGTYETATSGMNTAQAYLDAAVAAPGTAGVKVFFDEIDSYQTQASATAAYVDATVPAVAYNASNIYAVTYVTANTAAAAVDATKGMVAWTVDNERVITGGQHLQIAVDGVKLLSGGAGLTYEGSGTLDLVMTGNDVIDIAAIKNAAHVSRATAAGVTIDAKSGGEAIGTVSLIDWRASATGHNAALNNLGEKYTTAAAAALVSATTDELDTDDVITFTVGSNTVTTSVASTANSATQVAAAIASAWAAKYDGQLGVASAAANVTVTASSGKLSLVALDKGSRGVYTIGLSVAAGTGAQSGTTGKSLDWIIGATQASSDNTTVGQSLVVTVESIAAGTVLDATDGGSVVLTAAGRTALAASTYRINGTDSGAGTYTAVSEARNDVRTAEDGSAAATSNASTTDRTSWIAGS